MVRQGQLIAVVATFLIGCAVLPVVGGSGVRAEASQEEKQEDTEVPKIYRIPVQGNKGVLECREDSTVGAVFDYALGIGEKASPVEQARRHFAKRIEEGDTVEIAENMGGSTVGYYGEELRTVRVVRDGRVVALIHFKEGRGRGGGWLLDSYEACSEFSPAPPEATDDLPPKEHTEGTKEQQYSGGAESEGRCGETRKELRFQTWFYVTNDLPGCPKGGVLTGTNGPDMPPDRAGLDGKYGDDKIRGLGGSDEIYGSSGSDVIYGGPGNDFLCSGGLNGCGEGGNYDDVLYGGDHSDDLWASNGEDVLYGEDGNDRLVALDAKGGGRDKLYCGRGKDKYEADPIDYVDSSCEEGKFIDEKGMVVETGGPPLMLLAGAALLLGSGLVLSRYTIRRVS